MTNLLKFIATAALLATSTVASAGQFGASIKTPGFEDVVLLDQATTAIAIGADDGIAAAPLIAAYSNAQRVAPNKAVTSLTERVFGNYLPAPSMSPKTPSAVDLHSMLLKRKQDVIAAKRYLLTMPITPFMDMQSRTNSREPLVLRDNLGRYAIRLYTSSVNESFFVKDDETKVVSLRVCFQSSSISGDFVSGHGRAIYCLGVPNLSGMNIPIGFFVSDISKFGELGGNGGLMDSMLTKSPYRAGFIVTPEGRAGTQGSVVQGRNFTSTDLVIFNVETFEIVAGPFQLKTPNQDVIYATNHCKHTTNGLSSVVDVNGNCGQLNPTLPAGTAIDVLTN